MASTFLKPTYLPQPGDGAWLVQCSGRYRDHRFHREQPPDPAAAGSHDRDHVSNQRLTYTQPKTMDSMNLRTLTSPSPGHRWDEPLTRVESSPLSRVDPVIPTTFLLRPRQPYLTKHSYSGQESSLSHCTSTTQPHIGLAEREMSDAIAKEALPKGIPPHLRKVASARKQFSPDFRVPDDLGNVCEKLAELGVMVDEHKLVSPSASKVDPEALQKTKTSTELVQKTIQVEGVQPTDGSHPGRTKQLCPPEDNIASIGRRGRGGKANAKSRGARWPKPEETRPDPNRWTIEWHSDAGQNAYCSSFDSNWADAGLDDSKQKCDVANGGSFKLTDWSGDWAPAPVDWDARPPFRDSSMVGQINSWRAKIEEEVWSIDQEINLTALAYPEELVPRYWVPIVIGRQAPRTFWNEMSKSKAPMPMDDDDLKSVMPWWDRYLADDNDCVLLKAMPTPEIRGIDPDETLDERLARESDQGSAYHAENRRRREAAKRKAHQERKERTEEKLRKYAEQTAGAHIEKIRPDCDMFVRSARPADMVEIRDIYNYYVEFTCLTPEIERRTTADMIQRYNDILSNRLPFLVACERGGKIAARKKKNNYNNCEDIILPNRIVGFAFADDYNDLTGMYRFTAEVEVFTLKTYYMKGVAKCLLDKLIAMLDPQFLERGGFAIEGEELEGVGPSRTIQHIIMNVSYESPQRLEWMKRWVGESLGFEQVGNLPEIGNKLGKNVNLAVFLRKTGVLIDPANPPIRMKYPTL